ncbi:MAG TPA: NAD(P)-binding protein, partial [Chitinophagaceae bacterium]|nr:NAD(P)-binding protein [Chitinophagaceae bacterium]
MPSPKKKELSDEDYLDLFKIGDKKYLLGIYQDGITVYKQQIRALNIFQALFNTKKIKPGYTIGIIGGGVAGLTFAAACLKSGIAVQILEKHSTYLPMQSGCDIRRIHPNIYEWPEKGSQF